MATLCHSCGSLLAEGAAFCSGCGARVANPTPGRLRSTVDAGGNEHQVAIEAARRSYHHVRLIIAAFAGVGVLALVFLIARVSEPRSEHPVPIIKGPDYNEPAKPAAGSSNANTTTAQYTEAPTTGLKPTPEVMMPQDEKDFIRAVQQGQVAFRGAPNEMAQGGARYQRRIAICRSLAGLSISGWVGQIEKLSSNSDGKGVLEVSLADSVRVETWNNDVSDSSDHTLIDPASPLFAGLSQMKQHDQVVFSGTFFPSDVDCVKEHSLSLDGSMTDPEFVFLFRSIVRPGEAEVVPSVGPTANRGFMTVAEINGHGEFSTYTTVSVRGRVEEERCGLLEDRQVCWLLLEDVPTDEPGAWHGGQVMAWVPPPNWAELQALYKLGDVAQVTCTAFGRGLYDCKR